MKIHVDCIQNNNERYYTSLSLLCQLTNIINAIFFAEIDPCWQFAAACQQQHSFHVQLGHTVDEELALHSEGRQPQSAHLISIP